MSHPSGSPGGALTSTALDAPAATTEGDSTYAPLARARAPGHGRRPGPVAGVGRPRSGLCTDHPVPAGRSPWVARGAVAPDRCARLRGRGDRREGLLPADSPGGEGGQASHSRDEPAGVRHRRCRDLPPESGLRRNTGRSSPGREAAEPADRPGRRPALVLLPRLLRGAADVVVYPKDFDVDEASIAAIHVSNQTKQVVETLTDLQVPRSRPCVPGGWLGFRGLGNPTPSHVSMPKFALDASSSAWSATTASARSW